MDKKNILNWSMGILFVIFILLAFFTTYSQKQKIKELQIREIPYYSFDRMSGTKYFNYGGKEFAVYQTNSFYGCELKEENETFSIYCGLNKCEIRIIDWDCLYNSNSTADGCIDITQDRSVCVKNYIIEGRA